MAHQQDHNNFGGYDDHSNMNRGRYRGRGTRAGGQARGRGQGGPYSGNAQMMMQGNYQQMQPMQNNMGPSRGSLDIIHTVANLAQDAMSTIRRAQDRGVPQYGGNPYIPRPQFGYDQAQGQQSHLGPNLGAMPQFNLGYQQQQPSIHGGGTSFRGHGRGRGRGRGRGFFPNNNPRFDSPATSVKDDNSNRSKRQKKSKGTTACAGCYIDGHDVSSCVYAIDDYGFLKVCPGCGSAEHIISQCPDILALDKDLQAMWIRIYVLQRRNNKPPVMLNQDLRNLPDFNLIGGRGGNNLLLPWTPQFALEQQRIGNLASHDYSRNENRKYDGVRRDPAWDNPQDIPPNTFLHPRLRTNPEALLAEHRAWRVERVARLVRQAQKAQEEMEREEAESNSFGPQDDAVPVKSESTFGDNLLGPYPEGDEANTVIESTIQDPSAGVPAPESPTAAEAEQL